MQNKNNKPSKEILKDKYMALIKVGSKGQVVIPKEARELFGIKPGDSLILLADVNRGIAIENQNYFNNFSDKIFKKDNDPGE